LGSPLARQERPGSAPPSDLYGRDEPRAPAWRAHPIGRVRFHVGGLRSSRCRCRHEVPQCGYTAAASAPNRPAQHGGAFSLPRRLPTLCAFRLRERNRNVVTSGALCRATVLARRLLCRRTRGTRLTYVGTRPIPPHQDRMPRRRFRATRRSRSRAPSIGSTPDIAAGPGFLARAVRRMRVHPAPLSPGAIHPLVT